MAAFFFGIAPVARAENPHPVEPCISKHGAILIVRERNPGAYVDAYLTGEVAGRFKSVWGTAEEVIVFRKAGFREVLVGQTAMAVQFIGGCAVAEQEISLDLYWSLAGTGNDL